MSAAVLATVVISVCFAIAAGWNFYSGAFWFGVLNTGLTITNTAWAVIQSGH